MIRRLFEIVRVLVFGGVMSGSLSLAGCQWSGPHPSSGTGSWEARRSFVRWNMSANKTRTDPACCSSQAQLHHSPTHQGHYFAHQWQQGHCTVHEGCAEGGCWSGPNTANYGVSDPVSCAPTYGDTALSNGNPGVSLPILNDSLPTLSTTKASCVPVDTKECCVPASIRLAELPKSELKKLMGTCPAPSPASMQGHWLGVNRGIMLALTGNATFIKRFDMFCTANCSQGVGTNIRVCQVPLEQLGRCGWQPRLDAQTGQPDMHGNFLIIGHDPVELDYRKADNPFFEPTRFLVDELVQVEEGLLLGRANLQFLRWRIPVAYFALSRAE